MARSITAAAESSSRNRGILMLAAMFGISTRMGVLTGDNVLIAGLIELVSPSGRKTVLAEYHPGIWWGAVMVGSGILFYVKNRK